MWWISSLIHYYCLEHYSCGVKIHCYADRAPLTCIMVHPRLLFHFHLSVGVCACAIHSAPYWTRKQLTLSLFSSLPLLSLSFTHSGLGYYPFFGARDSSSSSQVGLTIPPLFCNLSPPPPLRSLWMRALLQRCCVTVFLFSVIFAVEQTCFSLSPFPVCQHVCNWIHK